MDTFRLRLGRTSFRRGLAGGALAAALALTAAGFTGVAAQEGGDDGGPMIISVPGEAPATHDSDRDGLTDAEEMNLGLNPYARDTDNDGLGDEPELYDRFVPYVTDPTLPDTDGDGLVDGAEVFGGYGYYTNPALPDTDFDGQTDSAEIFFYGTNPLVPDRF